MTLKTSPDATSPARTISIWQGMWAGFLLAAKLAGGAAFLLSCLLTLLIPGTKPSLLTAFLLVLLYIFVLGVLPALVVGTLSGLLIAGLLRRFNANRSLQITRIIGVSVGLFSMFALPAGAMLLIVVLDPNPESFTQSFPTFVEYYAIPSLLAFGGVFYLAHKINNLNPES